MGRGKTNFFDVIDKFECRMGKCMKSILGELCSGVSICPTKSPDSDMGAHFLPGPPPAGWYG